MPEWRVVLVGARDIDLAERVALDGSAARRLDLAERVSLDATYVSLATRRAAAFYAAVGYEDSAAFFRKRL